MKIKMDFDGLDKLSERLRELDGNVEETAKKALEESAEHIGEKIQKCMSRSKMPAGGKYWTGDTKSAIKKNAKAEKEGTMISIGVGFDFHSGKTRMAGMKSIFLMYGTPRMKPVAGLKAAIYGAKTAKEIAEIQKKYFDKEIKKMGG